MSKSFSRAMIAVAIACFVFPVIAGEGRTPIYAWQTTITQPGKYVVTRDIVPLICNTSVIDIQVPAILPQPPGHVDIDLNGFRVYACPGHPVIRAIGQDNITIRNGTLGFADQGIWITGIPGEGNRKVVVEDVKIIDVAIAGIYLEGVSDFALRRNNVVTSDFFLDFVGQLQTGILVEQGLSPVKIKGTIEDNQVERTGGGIVVRGGSSVAIRNNRVAELANANPGAIAYDISDTGLITENTVENISNGNGIFLGDATGCKVYNNVVRVTMGTGIYLAGFSDDNLVLDNVTTGNAFDGLRVDGSRNHIERNLMNSNGTAGLPAWGLRFFGTGAQNTYGRNTALGNPGPPGACAFGGGPNAPTTDFCDEGPGGLSFGDSYMPFLF